MSVRSLWLLAPVAILAALIALAARESARFRDERRAPTDDKRVHVLPSGHSRRQPGSVEVGAAAGDQLAALRNALRDAVARGDWEDAWHVADQLAEAVDHHSKAAVVKLLGDVHVPLTGFHEHAICEWIRHDPSGPEVALALRSRLSHLLKHDGNGPFGYRIAEALSEIGTREDIQWLFEQSGTAPVNGSIEGVLRNSKRTEVGAVLLERIDAGLIDWETAGEFVSLGLAALAPELRTRVRREIVSGTSRSAQHAAGIYAPNAGGDVVGLMGQAFDAGHFEAFAELAKSPVVGPALREKELHRIGAELLVRSRAYLSPNSQKRKVILRLARILKRAPALVRWESVNLLQISASEVAAVDQNLRRTLEKWSRAMAKGLRSG